MMMNASTLSLLCFLLFGSGSAFLSLPLPHHKVKTPAGGVCQDSSIPLNAMIGRLFRRNRKGVQTLEREQTKKKQKKKKDPEQYWRVMLYSTEWQPDIAARILVKIIPALDRVAAYELVCRAREMGKVALIITRKKDAELYCFGLQRQGLPATIEPHDVER